MLPLASERSRGPPTTLNASCMTLEAVGTCLQSKSVRLTCDGDTAQFINAGSFSSYVKDRVVGDHDWNITPSSFPAPGLTGILSSYPSQSPDGVDVLLVGKRDDVVHCGLSRVRDKEGTDLKRNNRSPDSVRGDCSGSRSKHNPPCRVAVVGLAEG